MTITYTHLALLKCTHWCVHFSAIVDTLMCTLWTHSCVHSDYFDGSLSHSKLFKCLFIAFRIFLTFGRYMAFCPFSFSLFATTINSYLRRLLTTLIADVLLYFGKFSISAMSFTDKATSKNSLLHDSSLSCTLTI